MKYYYASKYNDGFALVDEDGAYHVHAITKEPKVFASKLVAHMYCLERKAELVIPNYLHKGYICAKTRKGKWFVILENGKMLFGNHNIKTLDDCVLAININL